MLWPKITDRKALCNKVLQCNINITSDKMMFATVKNDQQQQQQQQQQ